MSSRLLRAVRWAIDSYRYQRNKPHGKKSTRRDALMLALQGAHLIAGQQWPRLNPTYWLLKVGNWRLRKTK